MLERALQNQERSDTSMRNMTEHVGSYTASIQKLEMQMRELSREQNPKKKGILPSDTIANPKGSGIGPTSHCMAVTTRSGKSKQEVEAQVEEPIIVEAKKVPEELKVQEVNQEEVKEKVKETPKTLPPIPIPPPPFPQRLARKVDDTKLEKFYDILKQLTVNIPFVEAFQEMPGFAKYLKDLITKKKTIKNEVVNVTHRIGSIIATTTVQKNEDPEAFTIPCTIGAHDFARALCDNGASINLMPLAIYKQVGLDDKEIPIILGRPFLSTGRALMDSEQNESKFRVNDKEVEQLLNILKEHRQAIGWTIADNREIPAKICEHKIQLENESKPSVENQ
ncbi:uncharacterized protein [Nicotiana sylvestris]|uniref:uncharacterized protein n=1 Tax=Nicotiana sylvestris TaxID=4096 RepID=UPI00388CB9B4